LVVPVILLVKLSTLLTTVFAAFSTPVTTVLAKSAPGKVGSVTGVPALPLGMGAAEGRAWPVLATQGL
jgi:hypothetical protein